ncbi:MAG: peptidylprolyl isomerase [Candidatus Acidiferrum sp.]
MRLLREPLLHFLLLGVAIFAAFSLLSRHKVDKPGEIVITQGTMENLVTGFTRTWQRPPTQEELRGLVTDYVREEVAYRRAVAMGLDRDDTIVRRRLQQKLEFLSDDLSARVTPTDADLQAFLQSHADKFKTETTLSFRQIYLNPQLHGNNLHRDEAHLLAHLQRSGQESDLSSFGDPFLLPQSFENISLSEVKKIFGEQFAVGISAVAPGQWRWPVVSGYGAHLVYVVRRNEGRLPALADIHDDVRRQWLDAKRGEATDKLYQALLKGYTIRIEPLEEKKVAQVH